MDRARGAKVEAYGIARVRGRAVPLAAPRCSSRYRGAFTRPARYRGAFTRPARWHGASARSRPAQRAITPQQWSQRAITPQQWSQRAITPHPRPLRVEIRVALHPAESAATLRHRYRHSIRLSVQFVATDCMANRRRSVSSRLGHLYVSKERQGPGRPNRRQPHGTRAHASSHLGRLCVSCVTCQCSDVGRPPTREGAVLPRRPRAPSTRQAGAQKRARTTRTRAHQSRLRVDKSAMEMRRMRSAYAFSTKAAPECEAPTPSRRERR